MVLTAVTYIRQLKWALDETKVGLTQAEAEKVRLRRYAMVSGLLGCSPTELHACM